MTEEQTWAISKINRGNYVVGITKDLQQVILPLDRAERMKEKGVLVSIRRKFITPDYEWLSEHCPELLEAELN